jgi:hypothetical protein
MIVTKSQGLFSKQKESHRAILKRPRMFHKAKNVLRKVLLELL